MRNPKKQKESIVDYEAPKSELIYFSKDEKAKTITLSIDGNDILASWLRGEN